MRLLMLLFRLLRRVLRGLVRPEPAKPARARSRIAADGIFHDRGRLRDVPYKVYAPAATAVPTPVVIFSHGLGGSCQAAPYLGRALAAAGYWGFFIQHLGSDQSLIEGASTRDEVRARLKEAMRDPAATRDRFLDLHFVIDALDAANAETDGRFQGKLDMQRVAMAGHSFGARSVLAAAGQRYGRRGSFKDGRITAGVALSPSSTRRPGAGEGRDPADEFSYIDIPILHVTGTRDAQGPSSDEEVDIAHRLRPYELIQASDQYLLVLEGARHGDMVADDDKDVGDDRYRRIISVAVLLFLDAFLRGNDAARDGLLHDVAGHLDPADRFSFK